MKEIMNIPNAILQMLGSGNTNNAISSILGLGPDQTQKATGAAVPSLLAGLTGLASTSQGAEQLAGAVSQQDSGIVDNLNGALSGQGPRLAEQGSGTLNSLLGGGMTSKLGGVLSRFTGVGEGGTGKLLGLLAPIILGFLGKQQKSMGLNAGGLASLLAGQKDNIRSAMPGGLETMLSSAIPGVSQLFGARPSVGRPEAEPGRDYEEAIPRAEQRRDWRSPVGANTRPSTTKRWALPLLFALAAIVGFLLWSGRERDRRHRVAPPPPSAGAPGAASDAAAGKGSSFVSDTSQVI